MRGPGRPKEAARDIQLTKEVEAVKDNTGCQSTRAALRLILIWRRRIDPTRWGAADERQLRNLEAIHSKALKNFKH